ncbi:MAG: tRNA (adenosine(37)-N6)-dimethylallyltransferase MiaA [Gammaproteobacteria bacterium]|nr:tRNA (adenosine(37)-N6)-dimethylallyltransferase MiaA [Gammaproteobacteria bacterium]
MGPTATGKTDLAVWLAERFPVEIISVDSALVYRGMDIGTAKPDAATLAKAPHRLIDICEPEETYSAGAFVRDAAENIDAIRRSGRIPLLVGGTMMYFRSLTRGIAELPEADPALRAEIDREAAQLGWPALHAELTRVDPAAAARIEPGDRQRIQRALEVYRGSGRSLTAWQTDRSSAPAGCEYLKIGLIPADRAALHARINTRFERMLESGFVDEVRRLRARSGLHAGSPSMRAVGYRQVWSYLDGNCDLHEAARRAQAATRQLAKRQLTWLRSEQGVRTVDPLEAGVGNAISLQIERKLNE